MKNYVLKTSIEATEMNYQDIHYINGQCSTRVIWNFYLPQRLLARSQCYT